jgi:hypothetical protein
VFIGDATFVTGARTDIAALYPTLPRRDQAGWGYLLLTNFLPNARNGTFTLHAYADDVDGHTTLLRIAHDHGDQRDRDGAVRHDRHAGAEETVSGTLVNFGWALTPPPKIIPIDGSTIQVFLDGLTIGRWIRATTRVDIQALFPGP